MPQESLRYSRQIALPDFGERGQRLLSRSSVLVVGVGGLGSPLATYLAAAGVGRLTLIDPDRVDATNLHRQPLYGDDDIGSAKVDAAAKRLRALNPSIEIETIRGPFSKENGLALAGRHDLVADGTDNFPARFLVNDACVLAGKPNVFAAVHRMNGELAVFDARRGPCFRCLHPSPPSADSIPSCEEAGVLGAVPGILGAYQALEALKLLADLGTPPYGRLRLFDALEMSWRTIPIPKNPDCPACSPAGRERALGSLPRGEQNCAFPGYSVATLQERLARDGGLQLLDVRSPSEFREGIIGSPISIPLDQLESRCSELDPDKETVVYCRSGVRSGRAVSLLRERGFSKAASLEGGLLAWERRKA